MDRLIVQRMEQPQQHEDVLALLLAAHAGDGARLSRRQLREEITTLLIAGHETLASALTWT